MKYYVNGILTAKNDFFKQLKEEALWYWNMCNDKEESKYRFFEGYYSRVKREIRQGTYYVVHHVFYSKKIY